MDSPSSSDDEDSDGFMGWDHEKRRSSRRNKDFEYHNFNKDIVGAENSLGVSLSSSTATRKLTSSNSNSVSLSRKVGRPSTDSTCRSSLNSTYSISTGSTVSNSSLCTSKVDRQKPQPSAALFPTDSESLNTATISSHSHRHQNNSYIGNLKSATHSKNIITNKHQTIGSTGVMIGDRNHGTGGVDAAVSNSMNSAKRSNVNNLNASTEPELSDDSYESDSSDSYSDSDHDSILSPHSNEDEDDDDDDDEDDDDEKWSVRVRLISAVDLPPNVIPSTPLCPLFKFGLVTVDDHNELNHLDISDELKNNVRYDHIYFSDGNDGDEDISKECSDNTETDTGMISDKQEKRVKRRKSLASFQNHIPLTSFSSSARIKYSSEKILSEKDNGMVEWHEELRWDNITSPLQTVLAVELSARAVLSLHHHHYQSSSSLDELNNSNGNTVGSTNNIGKEDQLVNDRSYAHGLPQEQASNYNFKASHISSTTSSSSENLNRAHHSRSQSLIPSGTSSIMQSSQHQNKFSSILGGNNQSNSNNNRFSNSIKVGNDSSSNKTEEEHPGGILGLWRKGRQTLEQRRKMQIQRNISAPGSIGGPRTSGVTFGGNGTKNNILSSSNTGDNNELEAASAAATVARFLMDKPSIESIQNTNVHSSGNVQSNNAALSVGTITTISSHPDEEVEDEDALAGAFDDMLSGSSWKNRRAERPVPSDQQQKPSQGDTSSLSSLSLAPPPPPLVNKRQKTNSMAEDLRLGTLLVPLSSLPLEDERPIVEKWYQLHTVATASSQSGTSTAGTSTTSGTNNGNSNTSPSSLNEYSKKVLSPTRSPSVLLEILLCSSRDLDESEDEAEEDDDDDDKEEEGVNGGIRNNSAIWDLNMKDSSISRNLGDNLSGLHQKRQGMQENALRSGDGSANNNTPKTMRRRSQEANALLQQQALFLEKERYNRNGPYLEPGIIDFACVVGAKDIGNQRDDDGSKGWVQSTPDCCVLEQFPPNDEFHAKNGRTCSLPHKIEWWCFPEGCKLWRGVEAPTHMDMNLKRFSASSPPTMASSIAAFDACLNCTTSFMWWVMNTNSDVYGSRAIKTYGAVIRFYVPAPMGIDPTQDDYAQAVGFPGGLGRDVSGLRGKLDNRESSNSKRLWCPLGICLTSSLPIIGIMEALLLRLCEKLASRANSPNFNAITSIIHHDLANLIINFQAPIPGVMNCSIPFLSGEGDRLLVTLPPNTGLPPLPHGASVTSVCRLLGAEGLTVLLAAVLTECKILIHSADVANLAMVAEVVSALIYPFNWQLPYIPVLPEAMLEVVEAPLSYFLGVPSCNMKWIEKSALTDVVVIDLDNGFSFPDYFDGRRDVKASKVPTTLPASVSSNISKAVFRLLREEEEVEEQFGSSTYASTRHLPRLEGESLAEREFRISVAQQICGLLRGYQECLFFVSASQPVFNRDRFLRQAPALFEDRKGSLAAVSSTHSSITMGGSTVGGVGGTSSQRIFSPRSKRFLSAFVNTQQFHALLERLDAEDITFFHEVMDTFEMHNEHNENKAITSSNVFGSSQQEEAAKKLGTALEKVEQKVPNYHVNRKAKKTTGNFVVNDEDDGIMEANDDEDDILGYDLDDGSYMSSFTNELLQPVLLTKVPNQRRILVTDDLSDGNTVDSGTTRQLSLSHLVELEKTPWRYRKLFDIDIDSEVTKGQEEHESKIEHQSGNRQFGGRLERGKLKMNKPLNITVQPKLQLREALGERKFRTWKLAQEKREFASEDSMKILSKDEDINGSQNDALELSTLISSASDDAASDGSEHNIHRKGRTITSLDQHDDARDRDVVRRCLERAYVGLPNHPNRNFRRRGSGVGTMSPANQDLFKESGLDLISKAEVALRNPSAQRFLVSVLSQRSRLENQRKRQSLSDVSTDEDGGTGARHRQSNQGSISRLKPNAFDCLVRLCNAMLEACMQEQDYESAYRLLTHTAGFCTVLPAADGLKDTSGQNSKVVNMTKRICMHPIFADLRLWERVLLIHQQDRQKDRSSGNVRSISTDGQVGLQVEDNAETDEYEAAVSTLYLMVGYGVPAEDLAKFATRVAEEKVLSAESGQKLLMLARRLVLKCDDADDGTSDLDVLNGSDNLEPDEVHKLDVDGKNTYEHGADTFDNEREWREIVWCHPTHVGNSNHVFSQYNNHDDALDAEGYVGRSAITSVASLGGSIVATGALDGSIFVAHTISFEGDDCTSGKRPYSSPHDSSKGFVKGVRLDWGKDGNRGSAATKGDVGVGAVSCLVAAKGAGSRQGISQSESSSSDIEDKFLSATVGSRIIAGTSEGDLRVWSVKDIYSAHLLDISKESTDFRSISNQRNEGPSSMYIRKSTDGLAHNGRYLNNTYRGRALSGHRGGVTCLDVPSHIYRPDSLISGGNDGLIKLWSLRHPTVERRRSMATTPTSRSLFGGSENSSSGMNRNKSTALEPLEVLAGHGGKILCVKTAWHGDRLLSGGADKTLRLWDLSSNSGKCLNTMHGHEGWITQAHYWGRSTMISGSTDRSIALWDLRAGSSPLFVLRYHRAPISNLLLRSRTEFLMVSAGGDGAVATWDFRRLSGKGGSDGVTSIQQPSRQHHATQTVRDPVAKMNHCQEGKGVKYSGAVLLSCGTGLNERSVISASVDGKMKEWDIASGRLVSEHRTGHSDAISGLSTFSESDCLLRGQSLRSGGQLDSSLLGGTITTSWDGTVRLRRLVLQHRMPKAI